MKNLKLKKENSINNKIVSIDLSQNIDGNSHVYNNFHNTFKKNEKKKQIELKSKIDIQMNYYAKGVNSFKSDKNLKRIIAESPIIKFKYPEEELNSMNRSKSREKRKKINSDLPKNLSNLETSEREDESLNINSKNKFLNLKKSHFDPCNKENVETKNNTVSRFFPDNELFSKSNKSLSKNNNINNAVKSNKIFNNTASNFTDNLTIENKYKRTINNEDLIKDSSKYDYNL